MKNIYSRIKDILSEATKSTAGVMSLSDPKYQKFKQGEGPVDKDLEKTVDPRLTRGRVAVYDPTKGKNVVVSKSSPTPGQLEKIPEVPPREASAIKPRMKATYTPKKELSPFEKEFARARAAGEKEFTWKNKEGKSYQVGTKLKGEVTPKPSASKSPAKVSVTPEKNIIVPDAEMKDIDRQKRRSQDMDRIVKQADDLVGTPAKKTSDEIASDQLWKDNREYAASLPPGELETRAARAKKEMDDIESKRKAEQQNNSKTNEETQMSINKKFNVSDSLYTAVMEVMKKPSQGSVPKNEKEKELAAMSPPGHLITHGDVLKARGVTMKEGTMRNGKYVDDAPRPGTNEVPVPDEGYRGPGKPLYTPVGGKKPGKKTQPGSTTKAMDDGVEESATQKFLDIAGAIGDMFTGEAGRKMMEPKKDDSRGMNQANQMKQDPGKPAQPKKDKSVKENTDTPGNSYEHQCAIHVKSESFGEGRTITTQHADVDENGHIAWYDVMFEHGIEKYVPTDELEILVSESHMHSMKKKKVTEAVRGYVDSVTGARPPANQAERDALAKQINTNRNINRSDTSTTGYGNRVTPQKGVDSAGTGSARGPVVTTGDFDRASPPQGTRVDPKATGGYGSQVKIPAGSGKMGGGGGGGMGGMMDPGALKSFKKMY